MENSFINKVKFYIWRVIYSPLYYFQYLKTRRDRQRLNILDSEQTCDYIIKHHCSISRYGDGELQLISHWLKHGDAQDYCVDSFQAYDPELAKRLYEVLVSRGEKHLVCLPYPFKDASVFSGYNKLFFEREYLIRSQLLKDLSLGTRLFGDAAFTRFYLYRTDIKSYPHYIRRMQMIWDKRDVLIVEGQYSRLGIGNDLFDNTKSIKRIICPATNAFSQYDTILDTVLKNAESRLVLIALGQTATVLAYDLSQYGIQAIDLGHVDIEYEWYLMGAKEKVPVPNKYVNEVKSGRISNSIDDIKYLGEIIEDLTKKDINEDKG